MRKFKRLIATLLTLVLCLGVVSNHVYAMESQDGTTYENQVTPTGYVTISVEKFVLGQGYIKEPYNMPFYEGEKVGTVLSRFLGTGNYNNGTDSSNISYLSSVKDTGIDDTYSLLPDYLKTALSGVVDGNEDFDPRKSADWLGQDDYMEYSAGWMYTVNHAMPNDMMGDYSCSNGDVIRVQFSLYGWGSDIGFDMMGGIPMIQPANKDNLMRKIGAINSSSKKDILLDNVNIASYYENAIAVLKDMTSTQEDVELSLELLNSAIETEGNGYNLNFYNSIEDVQPFLTIGGCIENEIVKLPTKEQVNIPEGSDLSGWMINGAGTSYQYIMVGNQDINLYPAISTPLTITYNGNKENHGGVSIPDPDNNVYYTGDSAVINGFAFANPEKNYSFKEWNTMADGTGVGYQIGQTITMGENSLVLYAIWTKDPLYTLMDNIADSYKIKAYEWSIMDMVAYGKGSDISQDALKKYLSAVNKIALSAKPSITDCAKVAIIIKSMGLDPTKITGKDGACFNPIEVIASSNSIGGVNGAAFGLIAYDNANFDVTNYNWTRDKIITYLKSVQHNDGGWALSDNLQTNSDPDVTSMVISALAPYYVKSTDTYNIKETVNKAVTCLSNMQGTDGKFASWGTKNSNSSSMVIVALTALGIDANKDVRFVKNDIGVVDGLLTYQVGKEGFGYTNNSKLNDFSTEQGFRALVSYTKYLETKKAFNIYDFTKSKNIVKSQEKNLNIRIEGISENKADAKDYNLTYTTQNATVYDALKSLLGSDLEVSDGSYGKYITAIKGEKESTFSKDYDGWQYKVNGKSPSVSIDSYNLTDNDNIVVYYGGMSIAYPNEPVVTYTESEAIVTFTTQQVTYGDAPNYEELVKTVPIVGAAITWSYGEGKTAAYVTNGNGEIKLSGSRATVGQHNVQIERYDETTDIQGKRLPTVVRFASDYKVALTKEVSGKPDIVIDVNVDSGKQDIIIASDESAALNAKTILVSDSKKATLPEISVTKTISNGSNNVTLDISYGTEVTASKSWDGSIELPLILENVVVDNKIILDAVKVGSNVDLHFNKPVRLFIPNTTGSKVGYIGVDGQLKEITNIISQDSQNALGDKEDGYIKNSQGTVIWTKHFTTFVVYNEKEIVIPPVNTDIKVTVSVTGDSAMGTILKGESVTLVKDSNAWSAIESALNSANISYSNPSGNYITMIGGLYEFDKGPNSGWLYYVNGSKPNVGVSDYVLKNGDSIDLRYTIDYTQDGSFDPPEVSIPSEEDKEEEKEPEKIEYNIENTLKQLQDKKSLTEWEILALVRNNIKVNNKFYTKLQKELKAKKGILRLPTDYAKLVMLLRASNKSPRNFAGYDLYDKIYNNKNLGKQGVNGYIFSLIALTGEKNIPGKAIWTQNRIITKILTYQNKDGGFSLSLKGKSDVDLTAMAVTALVPYKTTKKVNTAINKALKYIEKQKQDDGTFIYKGVKNCESIAQVIIAYSTLGKDPGDDLIKALLSFQLKDGTFSHTIKGKTNSIATEQALLALTAYDNYKNKKSSIYTFKRTNSKQKVWVKDSKGKKYLYQNGKRIK